MASGMLRGYALVRPQLGKSGAIEATWAGKSPKSGEMMTGSEQIITPRVPRSFRVRITRRLRQLWFRVWHSRRYGYCGGGAFVDRPFLLTGPSHMRIGAGVHIWPWARIEAIAGGASGTLIEIDEGTSIQPFLHIGAASGVKIGRNCLFASHVYITDHDHDWRDGAIPALLQKTLIASPVAIGDGVWLGERVCVLKGVTIGDGAIVGAGSVVTKDIPARCIAVGSPARVVKRWNDETREWESVR